jgi:hypothetical protein
VQEALAAEEALAAAIASWPAATSNETDLVTAHIAALRQTLGMSATPTTSLSQPASPSASASTRSATSQSDVVRTAVATEQTHLRSLKSVSSSISPLLAALAASDAALAESLRPSSPWLPAETQVS